MNKTIPMTTRSRNHSTNLPGKIRQQFLGMPDANEQQQSDLRIVLYSHDTMGIGHMRRNILIASDIKRRFPKSSILIIAGAKEACGFAQSANIECLTLPSFQKRLDGTYTSRNLGIPAEQVLDIRSRTILAAIQSYQPDLFVVDKVPSGAGGELLPALEWLSLHSSCRCILGLRDILDTPEKVIDTWNRMESFEIIRRHFQAIWIYGDSKIYDAVHEYAFPEDIAERARFTGYLDTQSRLKSGNSQPNEEPFVLCTVGGGQDGKDLSLEFVEAIRLSGRKSKLLTGPYMPESSRSLVRKCAETVPELEVIEFVNEGDALVKQASHVVSMGGYNTLAAVLSYGKPALVVPRVAPREEQLIRANRLAELGHVTTIHPDLATAESIAQWLNDTPVSVQAPAGTIDMLGLERICEFIHADFPAADFRDTEVRSAFADNANNNASNKVNNNHA